MKRGQTNILVSILLIAIFIVAFAIVFLVVRGVLIEKSQGIGSDYGSFLKMLFERNNSGMDVISGPGANTNNFGNNIYGSGDYINCSGGSGDYINCSDKSGEIITLGIPGYIKCNGINVYVSDISKGCCSPIDCGGNICNSTNQCTNINPCNGTGTFQKCFGYITTIQLNASNRDNIYWVWDALFVNNKIAAKSGAGVVNGSKNVSRTDIENYGYCYLTGHLAGEYRYHYGSPNDFYVPFRFDSTVPGRFCTVNITDTFCIGSSPGYNFVPGTYPKPGSVNPYTRIPPLGINYTVAGDYINVYNICDGCTQDSHCPNSGNPCTYYACSNNKCVLRSNITACTVSPIVENCTILGVPNQVYNLSSTFKVDKVVESKGCLVVTAPNVTLNCNGNSIINSSFPATAIFSDQIGTIIKNCRISAGGWAAIGLRNTAKNSLIFNNTIYNNPTAISIDLGPDTSIIIDSNNLSNNAYGIYHSLENGWTGEPADTYNVIKNNIIDNNDLGIFAHGSSETIKLNYIRKNSGGIYAAGKNNIITNNVIENNLGQGIHISAGLAGGTPYADTWINNNITRNRVCGNPVYSEGTSQVVTFIDNQCDSSNAGTCSWNCSSSCVDTDNGNRPEIPGVTTFGGNSYIDKCINSSALQEYYCSSSNITRCSYGCVDGACNPRPHTNVSGCMVLNAANEDYKLTKNLIDGDVVPLPSNRCIDIQAPNITLDCDGFAISGSFSDLTVIYSNQPSTVIKNCNISTGNNYRCYGINFVGADNSYIYNTGVYSNKYGIYLQQTFNSVIDNIIAIDNNAYQEYTGDGSYGVELYSSSNNRLSNIISNLNWHGIQLASSSNNNILTNITAKFNHQSGIGLASGSNNSLDNIIASSNEFNGLTIGGESNTRINNVNADSNSYAGIWFDGNINNTLSNMNLTNNNWDGIITFNSENNQFINITASLNGNGIYLMDYSNNNTLSNINSSLNSHGGGIVLQESSYNLLNNITANSNAYEGIRVYKSSNNQLSNIDANSNGGKGIELFDNSNNNNLSDITANSNGEGIRLESNSNNNQLSNINVNSNSYGILLYSSSNNKLSNINVNSNSYGIYIYSNANNNKVSNINADSNFYGFYIYSSLNNTLTNNTVSLNSQNGIYIYSGSNNSLNNNSLCDNAGYDFSCSDSNNTYGKGNKINFVSACSNPVWPSTSDYTTCFDPGTNVSTCRVLSIPNFNYKLVNDLVQSNEGSFNCITIIAKNITLDCQGHSISRNLSVSVWGKAIYSNQNNTTIKNCNISEWSMGTAGILLDGGSSSLIFNNSLSNVYNAIDVEGYNSGVKIINNIIKNSDYGSGIVLNGAEKAIINNNIVNGAYSGIQLSGNYNNITNNRLDSGFDGIRINGPNNEITNNTANYNSDFGIYLYSSSNNVLKNNNMSNNALGNFNIYGTTNQHFNNTIGTTNTANSKKIYYNFSISNYVFDSNTAPSAGMLICALCKNITVKNLNLSNEYWGVYLFNNTNSIIKNITANSNNQYGVYIYSSLNTSLNNNTMCQNEDYDFSCSESSNTSGKGNKMNLMSACSDPTWPTESDYTTCLDGATNVSKCKVLSTPNFNYKLVNDIAQNKQGNCITIVAKNITLDCQGYSISKNFSVEVWGRAIYSNKNDTTIKNCNIDGGYEWEGETGIAGILLDGGSGSLILDNSFYNVYSTAIDVEGYNSNVKIINNFIQNTEYSSGIVLSGAERAVIDNNIVYGDYWGWGTMGIQLSGNYNNITNNRLYYNSNGIRINGPSSYNRIINNTANGGEGSGIELYNEYCTNNEITNNTANGNSDSGIYLYLSSNNTLKNNIANSNSNGIYIYSSSNNTLKNNTANSNYYSGVILQSSLNTNLNNNTLCGNTYYDFSCSDSNYTSGKGNRMNLTSVCSNPVWPTESDYTACP